MRAAFVFGLGAVLGLASGCPRPRPVGGPCTYDQRDMQCVVEAVRWVDEEGNVADVTVSGGVRETRVNTGPLTAEERTRLQLLADERTRFACHGSFITSGTCTPESWNLQELDRLIHAPAPVETSPDAEQPAKTATEEFGSGSGKGDDYGPNAGEHPAGPVVRIESADAADIIHRIVRAHFGELLSCYERNLARDPDLEGRISISWRIGADGTVTAATAESRDLPEPEVGACMARAFRRWKFPKPPGGSETNHTISILVSPPPPH